MNTTERKKHWENIFVTKDTQKVSWYQKEPLTSLQIIDALGLPKTAKIIDAGCGDSYLPDVLLQQGYTDITLVDISEQALKKVIVRLGEDHITFVNADITKYTPNKKFDIWHDRAVFHFLNSEKEKNTYVQTVLQSVKPGGLVIVATFAEDGPTTCSGLPVQRYSANQLHGEFGEPFVMLGHEKECHTTPWGVQQKFVYCFCRKVL